MNSLQKAITRSQLKAESDSGNHTLDWNSESYFCTVSVGRVSIQIEPGSYSTERSKNFTVRLFNADGTSVFPSGQPQPRDNILYKSVEYLIMDIEDEGSADAFIRLVTVEATRGVHG